MASDRSRAASGPRKDLDRHRGRPALMTREDLRQIRGLSPPDPPARRSSRGNRSRPLELFALRAGRAGPRTRGGDISATSSVCGGDRHADAIQLWLRRTPSGFGEVAQDLTYAVRLLRRTPGVVTVTVLGLGLAIGVGTAVFSLVNADASNPPASSIRRPRSASCAGSRADSHVVVICRLRAAA